MLVGDTESDAPPPGFEHVKEGTHSLDNVINRLADAEVGAWMMSSYLPEERCGLEIALHEQPRAWADCCSLRNGQVTSTAEEDRVQNDGDAPLQAGGLQESELEPTTVAADDTPYTSAQSFEDLQLQEDLLKVSSPLSWLPVCRLQLSPTSGTVHCPG